MVNEISLGQVAIVVGLNAGYARMTVLDRAGRVRKDFHSAVVSLSICFSFVHSFINSLIASLAMRAREEAGCPLHGNGLGADAVAVDAAAALSAGHRSSLASLPAGERDCIASHRDEMR